MHLAFVNITFVLIISVNDDYLIEFQSLDSLKLVTIIHTTYELIIKSISLLLEGDDIFVQVKRI